MRVKTARVAKPSGLRYSFKLEGELNISAYVAQQNVNEYLLMRVPNLITSAEPDLELRSEGAVWVVPVVLTMPGYGSLGKVGHIVVDAQFGHVIENESTPCEEIDKKAERRARCRI
jgi:hypothetical protein